MPKVTFKTDMCKGCGLCVNACPKGILIINKEIKNYEKAVSSLQNQIYENQTNYKEEIQKLISNSHEIKAQSKNEIEKLTKQIQLLQNNASTITKGKIIKELTINDIMNHFRGLLQSKY